MSRQSLNPAVLRGQRVVLVEFANDHIDDEYLSWLSDPVLMQFSQQRSSVHTKKSAKEYRQTVVDSGGLMFSITELASGLRVGTLVIRRDCSHGIYDLGLLVGRAAYRRAGLGLDAWSTAVRWSLNEARARKVTGGTVLENVAMIRIMERSGMERECVRQKHLVLAGMPRDVVYYAAFSDLG